MGPKFPRAHSPVRKFHFKLEATESTSADTFKSSSRPPIPNRHGEPRRRGCRRRGSTCGRAGERLPAPASRNCPGVHRPVRAAIRPPSVIPAGRRALQSFIALEVFGRQRLGGETTIRPRAHRNPEPLCIHSSRRWDYSPYRFETVSDMEIRDDDKISSQWVMIACRSTSHA